MKPALRWIPTEVWVDVFRYPGKSRKQLGEIADKLGRKFAEFLQFYLHEWGKRTLGILTFKKDYVCKFGFGNTRMDIADTPMPENIKFFKRITIWHFDSSTIAFLRNISPLFTNDVNLAFHFGQDHLTNLRLFLDHLSPLLHGIHSLEFKRSAFPLIQQYFGPKLAQIKKLTIYFDFDAPDQATLQTSTNFFLNWLTSEERGPAEPRLLVVLIRYAKNLQQFIMAIKQQFLSAKNLCTFAIKLLYYGNRNPIANFQQENNLGEQLNGQFKEAGYIFQVFRHKVEDFTREQLQEWVNKTVEKSHEFSAIDLYRSTTIGTIDANAGDNEVTDHDNNDNVGKEEDVPSTSKKPKIA